MQQKSPSIELDTKVMEEQYMAPYICAGVRPTHLPTHVAVASATAAVEVASVAACVSACFIAATAAAPVTAGFVPAADLLRVVCFAVCASSSVAGGAIAAAGAAGVFRIFRSQLRLSVHTLQKKASASARPLSPRLDG